MTHRFANLASTLRLPSFVLYLIDELFLDGSNLSKRICRHRLLRSWPSLSDLVSGSARSVVSV